MPSAFPLGRFQAAGTAPATIALLQASWALLSRQVQDAENAYIAGISNQDLAAITTFPVSGGGVPAPAPPSGQLVVVNEVTGGSGGLSAFTSPDSSVAIGGTLTAPTVQVAAALQSAAAAGAALAAEVGTPGGLATLTGTTLTPAQLPQSVQVVASLAYVTGANYAVGAQAVIAGELYAANVAIPVAPATPNMANWTLIGSGGTSAGVVPLKYTGSAYPARPSQTLQPAGSVIYEGPSASPPGDSVSGDLWLKTS